MIHLVRAGPVTLAYYACKQSYANNTVIMCYFSSIFSSLTQLGIISFFIAIWPMAIASHLILSVILFIDITDHKSQVVIKNDFFSLNFSAAYASDRQPGCRHWHWLPQTWYARLRRIAPNTMAPYSEWMRKFQTFIWWSKRKLDAINASLTRRRHNEAIKKLSEAKLREAKIFRKIVVVSLCGGVLVGNRFRDEAHENFSCKRRQRRFAKHSTDVVGRYDCLIPVACVFIHSNNGRRGAHSMLWIFYIKLTPNMINEDHRYKRFARTPFSTGWTK